MVEWWSGGVVEWWRGGVVAWWRGGVVAWWSMHVPTERTERNYVLVWTKSPQDRGRNSFQRSLPKEESPSVPGENVVVLRSV